MVGSSQRPGLTSAWLLAALLVGLLSQSAGVNGQKSLNERLVRLPVHVRENNQDLQRLREGKPVFGEVELFELRLLRFGVPKVKKEFPSVLISLELLNPHGDADLYCGPWIWLRNMGRLPGPQFYVWKSVHSQGNDSVFLSAQSEPFNRARVIVEDSEKNNTKVEVAAFACAVFGESRTVSEFELRMELVGESLELVPEEQEVMKNIYNECCAEEGSCLRWIRDVGNGTKTVMDDGKEVELDFCHRMGSICKPDGSLRALDMKGYNMSCQLPVDELKKLTGLEVLELARNQLTGDAGEIAAGLSDLKSLQVFDAKENLLAGSLSSTQESCALFDHQLRFLSVISNNIGGRLPKCIFSSVELRELHVANNLIFGEIPDTIPVAAKLEAVTLSRNKFAGELPESFGNAKLLRFFSAFNNTLSGPIPASLGTLPLMEKLDLGFNRFASHPEAWNDADWVPPAKLAVISTSSNKLEGPFPSALGRAVNLQVLDISNNMLDGTLNVEKGDFPKLEVFNVSYNRFSGAIPEGVAEFPIFRSVRVSTSYGTVFDISNNQLSGEIPEFFHESNTSVIGFGRVSLGNNSLTCEEPDKLLYVNGLSCEPAGTTVETQGSQNSDKSASASSSGSKTASIGIGVGVAIALLVFIVIVAFIALRIRKSKNVARAGMGEEGDVEIGAMKMDDSDHILPQQVQRS